MTIAICTTTCGRPELTERTLESFMRMNPRAKDMLRLMTIDHTDSAADAEANVMAAHHHGWRVTAIAMQREGLMWGLRWMVREAIARGCTQMLWLENDWECVRGLGTVPGITDDIDCIRLYGTQKQADGARPAGTMNMVTGLVIPWVHAGDHQGQPWESAKAHFGGAPSIIDLRCIAPFIDRPTMKDMAKAMGEVRTLRPRENYFWHIGHQSTPGFVH